MNFYVNSKVFTNKVVNCVCEFIIMALPFYLCTKKKKVVLFICIKVDQFYLGLKQLINKVRCSY
jgi:hypothetical protein